MNNQPQLPSGFRWAALVPELIVADLEDSLAFWCGHLGFTVAYDRPEAGFSFIHLGDAQVMLEQQSQDKWITGNLERPLGRGINFQVEIADCAPALERLARAGWPLFKQLEEVWYRAGNAEIGLRQFLVQDPDGYLVRLAAPLRQRQAAPKANETP